MVTPVRSLEVALGARSYPIHIGCALLERRDLLAERLAGRRVLVVSDRNVAPLYLERARRGVLGCEATALVLPSGEVHKDLATLERIYDALIEARLGRDGLIVALGGGVVGDLAGFAAATYQRGVDFVQLPTTLLAQVDSAVGGKTAVNHPRGKNLIGAFHQPVAVLSDLDTLATLAPRELRAGLAEAIKYALIGDAGLFAWYERHLEAVLALEPAALAHVIERSCAHKAALVRADEREAGARALLNLGHTFGHAIETGLGYGRWLHGEAVAAGIGMAADLSWRLGTLGGEERDRICALLERAGLPAAAPAALAPGRLRELMSLDKKVRAGRLRLVLLEGIGAARLVEDCDPGALAATLREARMAA